MKSEDSTANTWRGAFHPRRELGRTGFKATLLGIGDLADRKVPLDRCVATIHRAMDAGLNLIDTAPNYEDGYSEQIVGAALKGRRNGMFVIDKIDNHHEPVTRQVDASLKNTGLDTVDCFVFHGVSTMEDWRKIAAPGGGMEQLASAMKAGKARFRGISSHHPDVLLAAIPSGLCDVVMFAVGPFVHQRYVEEILPLAKKHRVGTVCFKTFGAGKLLADTTGYNQPLQTRPRGKVSSGGMDMGMRKIEEACKQLQESHGQPKQRMASLNHLGQCYQQMGLFDMAIDTFHTAISEQTFMDESKKELLYNLGTAYEAVGDHEKAAAAFKEIAKWDHSYRDVCEKIKPSATPKSTLPRLSVAECLHYTLTLDPDVTLLGLSFPNEQDAAYAAAQTFKPVSPSQLSETRRRAGEAIQNKGPCWWNPPDHGHLQEAE